MMILPSVLQAKRDLDSVLKEAMLGGASDIHFGGEEPLKIRLHGEMHIFTQRSLSYNEVSNLLVAAYEENPTALSLINSGQDLDFAYSCFNDMNELLRFRVNASSRVRFGKRDYNLVFRAINASPPTVDMLGIEPAIVDCMINSTKGINFVVGATGSGKTTLLASIIRKRLEVHSEVIITHESPIEYVYDEIETKSVINQREIGRTGSYKNFYDALVGALRQDPDVILVGEARDRETINAALHGVQTGHALFTTVHTNGVAHTINRILKEFEERDREPKQMDIIDSTSIIVYQNLVPSIDGKRIALREYLIFDGEVKDQLRECPSKKLFTEIYKIVIEKGQTLYMDAQKKFQEGKIDEVTLKKVKKQFEADMSNTKLI